MKNFKKSPTFWIDIWLLTTLPLALIIYLYTQQWIASVMMLGIAAIMGNVRKLATKVNMQKQVVHLSLTEEDFRALVSGREVHKSGRYNDTRMILQDIGFHRMEEAIDNSILENRKPKE